MSYLGGYQADHHGTLWDKIPRAATDRQKERGVAHLDRVCPTLHVKHAEWANKQGVRGHPPVQLITPINSERIHCLTAR